MVLEYWQGEQNFGDALNPIIFNKLLPGFFDNDKSVSLVGIGSIIGFNLNKEANKRIIFSSGFTPTYAKKPAIDESYDFVSVRGPLTAKALNLDSKIAITDGAALLREFKFHQQPKKYKFSFMPHWKSESNYPMKELCEEAGIHYISPLEDPMQIIAVILQSEVVLAEAMHYAIVADTLRVPWIPVKAYYIDEFKWNDWSRSLDVEYKLSTINGLYTNQNIINKIVKAKLKVTPPKYAQDLLVKLYLNGYQNLYLKSKTIKQLKAITKLQPYLSKDEIFNTKVDILLERLQYIEKKYKSHISES